MQRAAPKVLFHSTLGVLLVACLSYMCIAIVAMMSKGGGQQGESYSLYMLISAAWFCANHGTLKRRHKLAQCALD
jgi:hypothetical protein